MIVRTTSFVVKWLLWVERDVKHWKCGESTMKGSSAHNANECGLALLLADTAGLIKPHRRVVEPYTLMYETEDGVSRA